LNVVDFTKLWQNFGLLLAGAHCRTSAFCGLWDGLVLLLKEKNHRIITLSQIA